MDEFDHYIDFSKMFKQKTNKSIEKNSNNTSKDTRFCILNRLNPDKNPCCYKNIPDSNSRYYGGACNSPLRNTLISQESNFLTQQQQQLKNEKNLIMKIDTKKSGGNEHTNRINSANLLAPSTSFKNCHQYNPQHAKADACRGMSILESDGYNTSHHTNLMNNSQKSPKYSHRQDTFQTFAQNCYKTEDDQPLYILSKNDLEKHFKALEDRIVDLNHKVNINTNNSTSRPNLHQQSSNTKSKELIDIMNDTPVHLYNPFSKEDSLHNIDDYYQQQPKQQENCRMIAKSSSKPSLEAINLTESNNQ